MVANPQYDGISSSCQQTPKSASMNESSFSSCLKSNKFGRKRPLLKRKSQFYYDSGIFKADADDDHNEEKKAGGINENTIGADAASSANDKESWQNEEDPNDFSFS